MYSPIIPIAINWIPPRNNITTIMVGYPGGSPPKISVFAITFKPNKNEKSATMVPIQVANLVVHKKMM